MGAEYHKLWKEISTRMHNKMNSNRSNCMISGTKLKDKDINSRDERISRTHSYRTRQRSSQVHADEENSLLCYHIRDPQP